MRARRILLMEANDQSRWIGSADLPQVHIPPVGLLSLAAYLRENDRPSLEIRVAESSLDAPDERAFARLLDEFKPDLLGVRAVNMFAPECARLAAAAKEWGDIPVVAGGPAATSLGEELLRRAPAVDLAVIGEGEETFRHLLSGAAPADVPGLYFRDGASVRRTADRPLLSDLDRLPDPAWDLVDLSRYERHLSYAYNFRRQGVMATSRGCPFLCTYCFTFGGKTVRLRSARRVFAEMAALADSHGVRDFYFVEDIFNIDKARARELCRLILTNRRDWRLYFVNGLRADLMDRELVDDLAAAGAVWITYAVETVNPRLQKSVKRSMNLEKARDMIDYTQDKGIAVNVNTMFGFPTETAREARETLDWLAGLRRPSLLPYHFCLRGYEGCEIVEQAERSGWDRTAFLADNTLSYNDYPAGSPTFSRQEMLEHVLEYHERFGLANPAQLRANVGILRAIGYTDRDLIAMYSVLRNRAVPDVPSIYSSTSSLPGSTSSAASESPHPSTRSAFPNTGHRPLAGPPR